MDPKDIVVFVEDEPGQADRLIYAARLAARWKAHLIVTYVTRRLELSPSSGFAIGAALRTMLEEHRVRVSEDAETARRQLNSLLDHHGLSGEWRLADQEDGEQLMMHARHASLAIVGPPSSRRNRVGMLSTAERTIFGSGRPTLLVPDSWPNDRLGGRIVVGWNGSREATNAISHAMPFLIAAEEVHLVVAPDAGGASLGVQPGHDMSLHLARHGVRVVLDECTGTSAGDILLDRCQDIDADMLVMGAYGRSKLTKLVFGGQPGGCCNRQTDRSFCRPDDRWLRTVDW